MLRIRSLFRLTSASRLFSTQNAAAALPKIDKEALKELRKRTGYSYVNCRKALLQFGTEHLDDAEKWLKELAIKEGWSRAANLTHRQTKNGLVSVLVDGHVAAVVEVNCETDFVARGKNFKQLVEEITLSALNTPREHATTSSASGDYFDVRSKEYDSLKSTSTNESLKELLTLMIAKLGENITVSKLRLITADPGVYLFGYAHPQEGTERVGMGKFVSVVGLKRYADGKFPIERLAQQICQHIVGMRSETLGSQLTESKSKHENDAGAQGMSGHEDMNESSDYDEVETTYIDESERRLLQQAFMLNPSQTVYEYVSGHGVKIVNFYRTEIGERNND